MGDTKIEWTDKTWSPVRARVKDNASEIAAGKGYTSLVPIARRMGGHAGPHCERVSRGCDNCYSETNNHRCLPANGTGLPFDRRARDLVDIIVDTNIIDQPLQWRTPKKVFVENQSDLFGEWVPDEVIDRVFATMAVCPQHTFQVLTKRPERMLEYFRDLPFRHERIGMIASRLGEGDRSGMATRTFSLPLPNVWLGVSIENQETADLRIPLLLRTAAAIRFCSYEPALGPVDFTRIPCKDGCQDVAGSNGRRCAIAEKLDWIIVGGESGPGARPFDILYARQTIEQGRKAGIAVFVKQLGAIPVSSEESSGNKFASAASQVRRQAAARASALPTGYVRLALKDRKGGDWSSWPHDLRVREFPGAANAARV